MDFDYIIADPTGNITVLILSPYTEDSRQAMIREAFESVPSCEQVGFIMPVSDAAVRLEMMAYEFCGNATLSAAAWHARMHGIETGHETDVTVISSGVNEPLSVHVINSGSFYVGSVRMPVPVTDSFRGYPLIRFDGISHLIVPSSAFSDEEAESAVKEYAAELGVPALGMMLTDDFDKLTAPDRTSDSIRIRPLVFVPGSDTLFWEHGCATGSTAVGWYRYDTAGITCTEAKQPGGIIRIDIDNDKPELTGRVVFRQ